MNLAEFDAQLGEAICSALREQALRLGVSIGNEPVWREAVLSRQEDPYSRETSLEARWQGPLRAGIMTFFPDGRVFAEYQVLQVCPKDPEHYIEAVQVWGRAGALKGELVLGRFGE